MPRRKKGKKLTAKKSSPVKSRLKVSTKIDKESFGSLKTWLDGVKGAKFDFQYDNEIQEINSDEDSDEFECNLKELEKPLKSLLKKFPDSLIRKRVNLECEWNKCSFETTDEKDYNHHVHDHLMSIGDYFPEGEQLKCLWNLCTFETGDRNELLRHLDYHSYHTRLKTFGLGLAQTISIPTCQSDSKFRNKIPQIPEDYFCYWNSCSKSYTKYVEYIEHVNYHLKSDYVSEDDWVTVNRSDRDKLIDIKACCKWDGCERECPNVFELKRHIKSHTNQKMIGCANCGTLFATKPLFINHCIRQVVTQKSFQCPDCFKFYPSEKILKDHTRSHVNKFQCGLCGLSCQKKSVLARHIRYRHVADKPFACDECDYKGKTKRDLEAHRNVHKKYEDIQFKCELCDYASRTVMALKRHDAKEHIGQPQTYQCHVCDKNFQRGYILSKHLIKEHSFKLAPGHSRFIYKQDLDGFYRLQTKRVENLKEISQRLLPVDDLDSNMDVSYEIDNIADVENGASPGTPINVRVKKIKRPKSIGSTSFSLIDDCNAEDSKDINDFAIVKKYKRKLEGI